MNTPLRLRSPALPWKHLRVAASLLAFAVAALPCVADFMIVALPDTQNYVDPLYGGDPAMFTAQTQWIQNNQAASAKNIRYVAHLGDMSDTGDGNPSGSVSSATQWSRIWTAMSKLESPVSIPYGPCVGNHDQWPNNDPTGTTTRYNQYFGVSHFAGRPYYGGNWPEPGKPSNYNDSHFDLFTADGQDYIVIYAEYDPGDVYPALTDWVDAKMGEYPNRKAIIVTHHAASAGANYSSFGAQGNRLYNKCKARDNFFMMLGGHVDGNYNFRRDPSGSYSRQKVTTLVSNYQFDSGGGNGYMRLYKFAPNYGAMYVQTYSPYLNQYKTNYGDNFTQSLDSRGVNEEGLVVLSDNRLVVASVLSKVNGVDTPGFSTVCVSFQSAAKSATWGNWIQLTGQSGFRHAHATAFTDNRVAVFAIGQASDAWVRYQTAPGATGAWSSWVQIPGTPLQTDSSKALSYVKGVRLSDNRLAAIGWSDGGSVYYSQQSTVGGAFSAWTSLGGSGFRQGDVVRLSDDRLVVFGVGFSSPAWANVQTTPGGAFGGWASIPGGAGHYSYITALAKPDDSLVVFTTRVADNDQVVENAVSTAGGASWSNLSPLSNGGVGFDKIHAVLRSDGRIALFGSAEHSVAYHCVQPSVGAAFGAWTNIGPSNGYKTGSVKGAVLSDNSMAALSHGASTFEYYSRQNTANGSWVAAAGLPTCWTR